MVSLNLKWENGGTDAGNVWNTILPAEMVSVTEQYSPISLQKTKERNGHQNRIMLRISISVRDVNFDGHYSYDTDVIAEHAVAHLCHFRITCITQSIC